MQLHRSQLHRFLALLSGFCFALLLIRIVLTGRLAYSFLVWNLFLAMIPYGISNWLLQTQWIRKHTFPLLIFLGIWLLFLPNAPYIITDFMHFYYAKSSMRWLDPMLLFSFALNGLLLGIFSMQQVFQIVCEKWSETTAKRMLFCVVFLCGFGIYLGRFHRWNSWEILSHPTLLVRDCIRSAFHPSYRVEAWGMTLSFGGFLWLALAALQAVNPIKKASLE